MLRELHDAAAAAAADDDDDDADDGLNDDGNDKEIRGNSTALLCMHFTPCRVTITGSYMAERMGFRAKELVVEKAAVEEAMAKEEVCR